MDNIIKDMYFGNILPFWEIQHRTKEYDEKSKQILKIQKELLEAFPEAEQLLESYCTAHYESADIFGYQQFQLGMKVGAQIMMEMLKPIERQIYEPTLVEVGSYLVYKNLLFEQIFVENRFLLFFGNNNFGF